MKMEQVVQQEKKLQVGTGHVSCELLRNAGSVFQCSGEAQWIERDNVLVSLMVSESMEMEGVAQHDVFGMQQGILQIPSTALTVQWWIQLHEIR